MDKKNAQTLIAFDGGMKLIQSNRRFYFLIEGGKDGDSGCSHDISYLEAANLLLLSDIGGMKNKLDEINRSMNEIRDKMNIK